MVEIAGVSLRDPLSFSSLLVKEDLANELIINYVYLGVSVMFLKLVTLRDALFISLLPLF